MRNITISFAFFSNLAPDKLTTLWSHRVCPIYLKYSVEKYRENVFLWEKRNTSYKGLTYGETHARVVKYAAGLLKERNWQKGDRVAVIAEGRNDWVITELAVFYCGGISVPLSVKIEEDFDLLFRLKHSGCKAIAISANHQHKIFRLADQLPDLELIILLDGKPNPEMKEFAQMNALNYKKENIVGVEEVVALGAAYLAEDPFCVSVVSDALRPDDYANICYTSGTTADPKGIILTHGNYICNAYQCTAMFEVPEYYTSLHILPWDHSFAHTVGIYVMMLNGASFASLKIGKTLNETLRNIPICIKEVRPYFMLSVPALAKNFKNNIEKAISDKGKVTKKLFETALNVGIRYNREGYNKGTGSARLLKPLYMLFDKILFSKIRENFGGRMLFFVGGGALLDIELQRFFFAIGMPMYQGYGLSEAAPVISSNHPGFCKMGTSGKVVPNLEIKILDDKGNELPLGQKGEIVVKGDNVMAGYWNNEKATQETLRDGWLFTGDLGFMDEHGCLSVLGRSKSLLISNDGEKYSPEGIEEAIVEKSPFIEQMMLYNNQNPYTSALIMPNRKTIREWAEKNYFDLTSEDGQRAVLLKLQAEIARFLPGGEFDQLFPGRWIPSTVFILNEPFSEQNKMINSTMKMVRPHITEHYKDVLQFLCTPDAKDICNMRNMENIRKLFAVKEQEPTTA
jgi:long-chain acyl-CoA synthetase